MASPPILCGAHPSPPNADTRDYDFAESEIRAGASFGNNTISILDAHQWRVQQFQNCVGYAIVQAIQAMAVILGMPFPLLASMYTYGWGRAHSNPPKPGEYMVDGGCSTRAALAITMTKGVVAEEDWAETAENVGLVPDVGALQKGVFAKVARYHRIKAESVENLTYQLTLALQLARDGKCAAPIFVMPIYENYPGIGSAIYTKPEGNLTGYHAQMIAGYDPSTDSFLIPGTWGTLVGDNGLFRISAECMFMLGFEFWVAEPEIADMKVAA